MIDHDAYDEGYDAYWEGVDDSDNPYKEDTAGRAAIPRQVQPPTFG